MNSRTLSVIGVLVAVFVLSCEAQYRAPGDATALGPQLLTVSATASPSSVSPGQDFTVAVEVRNVGDRLAVNVALDPLDIRGAGHASIRESPLLTSVNIAAGEAHTFVYVYRASAMGDLKVK